MCTKWEILISKSWKMIENKTPKEIMEVLKRT